MPINPVHFAHSVCDEFLRYIFSAFPLSDPELAEQARKLLERPSSLDIPLVKGPFVSLSEAFAKGESVQAMADRGTAPPVMPGLIGYPSMWLHQQQVFEAVKARQHVLVATGTGSGKTESFLYPIVDDLLRQRDQGIHDGLTAILVYPMNALANDQLDRLRDMLGGTGHHLRPVGRHDARRRRATCRSTASRAPAVRRTWPPASSAGKRPRPRTGPCAPWPRPRSAAPRRTSAAASPASC